MFKILDLPSEIFAYFNRYRKVYSEIDKLKTFYAQQWNPGVNLQDWIKSLKLRSKYKIEHGKIIIYGDTAYYQLYDFLVPWIINVDIISLYQLKEFHLKFKLINSVSLTMAISNVIMLYKNTKNNIEFYIPKNSDGTFKNDKFFKDSLDLIEEIYQNKRKELEKNYS